MLTRDSDKKAEKHAAKEAEKAAKDAERERQEFLASPVGQARTAYEAGDVYFQFAAPITETKRTVMGVIGGDKNAVRRSDETHADALGQIEKEGWKLAEVGYVFEQTGSVSRDKLMSSGQTASVTGNIVGVYLFRRAG
jgi:hypothetical protein